MPTKKAVCASCFDSLSPSEAFENAYAIIVLNRDREAEFDFSKANGKKSVKFSDLFADSAPDNGDNGIWVYGTDGAQNNSLDPNDVILNDDGFKYEAGNTEQLWLYVRKNEGNQYRVVRVGDSGLDAFDMSSKFPFDSIVNVDLKLKKIKQIYGFGLSAMDNQNRYEFYVSMLKVYLEAVVAGRHNLTDADIADFDKDWKPEYVKDRDKYTFEFSFGNGDPLDCPEELEIV